MHVILLWFGFLLGNKSLFEISKRDQGVTWYLNFQNDFFKKLCNFSVLKVYFKLFLSLSDFDVRGLLLTWRGLHC